MLGAQADGLIGLKKVESWEFRPQKLGLAPIKTQTIKTERNDFFIRRKIPFVNSYLMGHFLMYASKGRFIVCI